MGYEVDESRVIKVLENLPKEIRVGYLGWKKILLFEGFDGFRTIKGFHFEKLRGSRKGQYSCRLNKGYRVIFERSCDKIVIIVLEVNKHEY